MNLQKEIPLNNKDSFRNSLESEENRIKTHKSEKFYNKKNIHNKLISNNHSKQNSIIEISSSKKKNHIKKKGQILEEISILTNKIKQNETDIKEIKIQLINLKQEKKTKKEDIVNFLSNKESIEEIYKNKIYFLINREQIINENNEENMNKKMIKSDNFNLNLSEIKESDQNKFIEQIINMVNDIFKKQDEEISNELRNIIISSYKIFNENKLENNDDLIMQDFFTKISLYISNQSLGKFQESEINLLLRYLLQINIINQKLEKYLKFVNKKYKEQKKELNNSFNDLEKRNKNLLEKKNDLEKQLKEIEEISLNNSNNISESEKENKIKNTRNKNENKIIYTKKNISKSNNFFRKTQTENNNMNNKENKNEYKIPLNEKLKTSNNPNIIKNNSERILNKDNNQLNHDIIIEYEDGIDKNVEINYEEDINNQYNYEKENELIEKGINPYSDEISSRIQKEGKNKEIIKNNNGFEREEKIENNGNRKNRIKNYYVEHYKEKRKIDRRKLMKKINDYTFNIKINSSNENIFTENNNKSNSNYNKSDKMLINKMNKNLFNENVNKRKNELYLPNNINYNDKDQKENEEIITYKISSINKNKLQELSDNMINQENIKKENIIQNYNSNILLGSNDYNNFSSKNVIYKNNNCLTNNDDKNHNYISIINITNNAPIQNKKMSMSEDEKVCNIDNFENENGDELKINTMKIKNNILNEINENKNFDINNNDFFIEKEKKEINFNKIKNNNAVRKKSQNSKNENKIDLIKFINKNSDINNINEDDLKNKNLTLKLDSLNNTNYIAPKKCESDISEVNQIFSDEDNILSPLKLTQIDNINKNDFFNNINSSTLKITKTKEVNLKEIKNNKLNFLSRKKLSKTINPKNLSKQSPKFFSDKRDKYHIKSKIKKSPNTKNTDSFTKINIINKEKFKYNDGFHININKNNLSLDRLKLNNNNKIKLKCKLSPNVIKKLKLINLPISKNHNLKTEYNFDLFKNKENKNNNQKYSFYEYINSNKEINKNISKTKQSICYYRIFNRKNEKINFNENIILNIEKIGFSKGYISIILKSDLLQFIPKINNNNEIAITLKNIIGVQIEQEMQNIINAISSNEKVKENKEINNNIFVFNLLISDFEEGKIECVFDNFEIFMFWMKFLEQISEYYRNCDNNFNFKFE